MPQVWAARSRARAKGTQSSVSLAPATRAMGVTEMRLFTMGMPNSRSMSSPVLTSFSAYRVILS